jgi:Domain of unknown function (DUF4328)
MDTAGAPPVAHIPPPVAHYPHRVADPQDPPRELSGLAWGAMVSLGLVAILSLVRIMVDLNLRSVASDEGDVPAAFDTFSTWTGLHGLVFLIGAGVFIAWFFRAYKNLRRLGVQNMRYGDGWAIGAWFIPIFSLIRPKQMANDIWRGSERGVDVWMQWRQVAVPSLVHWWWGLFLFQGLLTEVGRRMIESGYNNLFSFGSFDRGISQIENGTTVDVLGGLCTIAAAVLAIMVVSQVSKRLDEIRNDALAASPGVSFAAPAGSMPPPPPPAPAQPVSPAPMPPASPVAAPPPPAPAPPQPPPPAPVAEQRIQCPECAEWIQSQANVCRFCGHRPRPTVQ